MRILTWIVWVITLIFMVTNLVALLVSNSEKDKVTSLINTVLYGLISYILASQVLFIY